MATANERRRRTSARTRVKDSSFVSRFGTCEILSSFSLAGRWASSEPWVPEEVRRHGGIDIEWRGSGQVKAGATIGGALNAFLRAGREFESRLTIDGFLAFARRYGVPLLCEHGDLVMNELAERRCGCRHPGIVGVAAEAVIVGGPQPEQWVRESCWNWFQLTRAFSGILSAGESLMMGKSVPKDARTAIMRGLPFSWAPADVIGRADLARTVSRLLEVCDLRPYLEWPSWRAAEDEANLPQLKLAPRAGAGGR